jgi:glutaredoxin 3
MNITVYSRTGCPYCDKIKSVLEQRNIEYTLNELDVDFVRDEFYEKFGVGATFPQVVLDEKNIGGCTDAVKYMVENNLI